MAWRLEGRSQLPSSPIQLCYQFRIRAVVSTTGGCTIFFNESFPNLCQDRAELASDMFPQSTRHISPSSPNSNVSGCQPHLKSWSTKTRLPDLQNYRSRSDTLDPSCKQAINTTIFDDSNIHSTVPWSQAEMVGCPGRPRAYFVDGRELASGRLAQLNAKFSLSARFEGNVYTTACGAYNFACGVS